MRFIILIILLPLFSSSQTLRINEFSNGTSGSKEWIEILVAPTSPTPPSLRSCFMDYINVSGWIIDDNDGTFSPPNNLFGAGFATGHLRFKNVAPWTKLPVGALVVIYNNLDKEASIPPDDPYDVNHDCVYVLPANHISLESCTTAPVALTCSTSLSYPSCTTYGAGNWNTINAANVGDGMQIRDASLSLIHGIVYGKTSSSSCGTSLDMIGNSSAPLLATTSGIGISYAYNGLDLSGYYDATKWTLVPASSSTPGAYNSSNNEIWIKDTIRKGCICDVTLDWKPNQFYLPQASKNFYYQVCGNSLVIYSSDIARLEMIVYSSDGRKLNHVTATFRGKYIYEVKGPFVNIVNVKCVTGFARYLEFTTKILNL